MLDIEKFYSETCDLYLIPKSDNMRKKSEEFFQFFNEFFSAIQKELPKKQATRETNMARKM